MSAGHTLGRWTAFNMVHAERGDALPPEEIGEYVEKGVRKTGENGGSLERFLFISVDGDGGDICLIGNGPEGPANARLIAAAPELLGALEYILPYLRELDRIEKHLNRNNPTGAQNAQVCINNVRNAIAKATGA